MNQSGTTTTTPAHTLGSDQPSRWAAATVPLILFGFVACIACLLVVWHRVTAPKPPAEPETGPS